MTELNLRELETVTGGTVAEFKELLKVCSSANCVAEVVNPIGGQIPLINTWLAKFVATWLTNDKKISVDFDLGIKGTGLFEGPNTYVDMITGERLSHAEVIRRLSK